MPARARRTVGRAGKTVAPGRQARRYAPVLAILAVATGYLALDSWRGEADLRDLDWLDRTTATVVEHDNQRRRADLLRVDFTAGGAAQQATVPYSGPAREGDQVAVAFVPDDPARVRTVEGWSPAYERWAFYAIVLGVGAVVLGAFGVVSRLRRGRWEVDNPVGEAPVEPLGRRIVRGSLAVPLGTAGAGVAIGAAMSAGAALSGNASLSVAGAAVVALLLAAAAVQHWWRGRDGVWATDEALVARSRSTIRSWSWDQVLELGMVVDRGVATVAAARVRDGDHDGIGEDGWVTLARPLSGPLTAHTWATRLRRLAEERGLPFTEGLAREDLADVFGTAYSRRRRPSVSG